MHAAVLAWSAWLLAIGPQGPPAPAGTPQKEVIRNCLVTLKHDVDVPAEETGVLMEIAVEEGQRVRQGQLIARIDDTRAQALLDVAKYQLEVAKEQAGNDVNVRHAKATAEVREQELIQVQEANAEVPGAVSYSEVRRLALALNEARLAIEQAQHDLNVAAKTVLVREAELRAAQDDVRRRKITAPLDGLVVKRYAQVGNWVKPGDPVVRVISVDVLRVEGYLDAHKFSPKQVENALVTGRVNLPGGQRGTFQGRIVFASPEIEAGFKFLVRAQVDNKDWLLHPGQVVDMTVHLDRKLNGDAARQSAGRSATSTP
ncbi:MAG TPA: HlyD family efflux transporter periplasmic adaptor subunit [Planctomycetaceae bacterium]|nr:HlyD family efflux transporter periplasmic adaptor subunit [Planctomycetaceae bacterium]HIQ21980.1 HlyD family efflux transporter periplasmic adaptor subunit [Planctomycetota bacterium]